MTGTQITNVMSNYGDVKKIQDEVWSQAYRFKVKSGVGIIDIGIRKHIPSHIKIEGHRALISYEGQLMTCFRCNEQGHQISECPRKRIPASHTDHDKNSWANVVKRMYNNEIASECNDITDDLTSINDKTQSSTILTTNSSESNGKQQIDPTTTEPHPCQPINDSVTQVDNIQETDNIEMLEEETNMAPQAKHNETPNETKWDNTNNTDVDAEHDQEKHGEKRDKSRLTKSDKHDEKESDDSTMESIKYPQTQMSSPKRLKKYQVGQRSNKSTGENKKSVKTKKAQPILTNTTT